MILIYDELNLCSKEISYDKIYHLTIGNFCRTCESYGDCKYRKKEISFKF